MPFTLHFPDWPGQGPRIPRVGGPPLQPGGRDHLRLKFPSSLNKMMMMSVIYIFFHLLSPALPRQEEPGPQGICPDFTLKEETIKELQKYLYVHRKGKISLHSS